ncbi:uncharacterized protein LOC126910000 [Daktulosphaira vitifoliae]|uniref:uncharacterized protein LOC126910000 n=1 Tax=Daktulosphaira vitifoliae TaxID=58002 RepID=UPI0021A9C4F7|nr:uncharacterized protein LOC126910000 [Daktulosphaira vitifoliae]
MKMYELYVKLISLSAGCASSMLMLTPLLVCRDIIQKKSSDHVKVGTFTGAFFRSSLFFRQGQLLNLQTVMYVHGMGLILNFLYISLYYFYSSKKNEVIKNVFNIISISFILILYSVFESKEVVSIRYPSIVSVIHILIIAWPLLSLVSLTFVFISHN